MNMLVLSIICFFIGMWSEKRVTEACPVFNTVESVEYKIWRYKASLGNKSEKIP